MYKLWCGQGQFKTILSFDLQVWPWPLTYLNKCFKWHFSLSRWTTAKLFWNPCVNVQVMARKNPDGRTMHARTSHAQATHNACTYTELKLYQLCLAPCKLARQKCNGIKTAKEDFKESPSFEHPIILSKDTCGRFFSDFVHYYRPLAVLLP